MSDTVSDSIAADAQSLSSVRATLGYAGDIQGPAEFNVVEPARTNLVFDSHDVEIFDVRPDRDRFSLDVQGFAYIDCPSSVAANPAIRELNLRPDNLDHPLNHQYMAEVAERLKALTGAREVLPQLQGLVVRTTGGPKQQSWAGPAPFVHLDYTLVTAHLFCALAERDYAGQVAPYRRFAVYQTWRAISAPPQDNVLAVCDGRSIPPDDAIVFRSVLGPAAKPGTQFDARLCRYNASHRWYFLSAMTLDDLLVFKGFDSDAPDTLNAMHTAFTNPGAGAGASPRESIEARFFAFFD